MDQASWAQLFDHTLLRPDATEAGIERLVKEGLEWGFWSVCVHPLWVGYAKDCMASTESSPGVHRPVICSVVGFPSGAHGTGVKVEEARRAISQGASEIDMVISIGLFLSSSSRAQGLARQDLKEVVDACQSYGVGVKVIFETGFLSPDQIKTLCDWSVEAGAAFVKTSTGFGPRGASLEDLKVMVGRVKGTATRVKASGGIKDYPTARAFYEAGAQRLGSSQTVAIMNQWQDSFIHRSNHL